MKKYFIIIGRIHIISVLASAFVMLICIIAEAHNMKIYYVLLSIIGLIIYLFMGLALGLLFISHAEALEKIDELNFKINTGKVSLGSKENMSFNAKKVIVSDKTSSMNEENKSLNANDASIEANSKENIEKQTNASNKIEIDGQMIRIGDSAFNIKYCSNFNCHNNEVSFIFYGKNVSIKCSDEKESSDLYNLLLDKHN